jgi:DNA-binding NarL/FixJ family response regulator
MNRAAKDSELEVLLIEDHLSVRKGIELLLRSEGMRVAGVAGDVNGASRLLRDRRHDVALLDLGLDGGSGIDVARERMALEPNAAIVLYTGGTDTALLREGVDAGARGFVLKSSSPQELLAALRKVAAGGTYIDLAIAEQLAARQPALARDRLSPREREVLDLLADGLTGEEIAARLYLSAETVRTHVRNAMRKLGAKTRVHAVALVLRERALAIR